VREKGTLLVTAGGKAPGPGPLRICHDKILGLLENKKDGDRLSSVEVSDIACFIADAVLAGGIRRAAMIALFDKDDEHMLHYKSGAWYELHPERARVNVSAICLRETTTKEEFEKIFKITQASGAGEPGIIWSHDLEELTNPCAEIALRSHEFCNLTTINLSDVKTQAELNERVGVVALLGTLQAGFTDFHYLGHTWEDNCKEEALLGISMTGACDNPDFTTLDLKEASDDAMETNFYFAEKIGINKAARVTCIKPEGTASLVLGSASGIHGRHAPFYIRRFRFKRNEPIVVYFASKFPNLVVEDKFDPDTLILELPQKSPSGSIMREEPAHQTLERAQYFHKHWVAPGHRSGPNGHNVSVTVSVKEGEWESVGKWMWENRNNYNGISLLPYDGGSYVQAPFEDCTEETYNKMMEQLKEVDLSEVVEDDDATTRVQEAACSGGSCEI
jgi:ribonucleoside-diphosphate reductase alpha chain